MIWSVGARLACRSRSWTSSKRPPSFWTIRESLRDGTAISGAGLDRYGWLWFVVLGLALGVGALEAGIRGLRGDDPGLHETS